MIRRSGFSKAWIFVGSVIVVFFLFRNGSGVLYGGVPKRFGSSILGFKHGPRDIHNRLARSEDIWQESVLARKVALAKEDKPNDILFFEKKSNKYGLQFVVWDFFTPSFTCPWEMQRIGRFGDGGKWVCGLSKYMENTKPELVIYSFGINGESSWESTMLEKVGNAVIYGYDYSVNGFGPEIVAFGQQRALFGKIGLGAKDEPLKNPPYYSLKGLMEKNGHSYIDILKIDVEGSEYEALDAFMDDFQGGYLPIGQVLIEIHLWDVDFQRILAWWDRLESFGLRTTWSEPNFLAVVYGNKGNKDPLCSEFVWINTKDPHSVILKE